MEMCYRARLDCLVCIRIRHATRMYIRGISNPNARMLRLLTSKVDKREIVPTFRVRVNMLIFPAETWTQQKNVFERSSLASESVDSNLY